MPAESDRPSPRHTVYSNPTTQSNLPYQPIAVLDPCVANQWPVSPLQPPTRTSPVGETALAYQQSADPPDTLSPSLQENQAIQNGRKEEQVQVDRRKLEQMIVAGRDSNFPLHDQVQSDGFSTSAEAFFTNVMRTTNTVITWPTKLKVGAKTKKDPFVKIAGAAEDVDRAKKLILSILETRHNRVTIKIDVAFTDHSHIIGKQGRNTQLAMKQTSCHIHFPDSNRNPDLEKSNMVSIAGPMQTVDHARRILRELSPLVITIDAPTRCGEDPMLLADDPLVKELSPGAGGVSVVVRTNRSNGCPIFVIRGSVFQSAMIRAAALRIQQRFMNTQVQAVCSATIDVLQQQHPIVLGPQNINIQLISQRTGATIHYPRGDTVTASPTTFLIQGAIDAVLSARKHLVGCLPMSFVFESHSDILNSANPISELEKQLGLSISLRPKRNGEATNVIVKGQERQASAMYEIRRRLVNGGVEELPVSATDFEFMQDFDPNLHMRPSPLTSTALSMLQSATATPSALAISTSVISPVPSPAVFGFPAFCPTSPFSPLPPAPVPSPTMDNTAYSNSRFSPIAARECNMGARGRRSEESTTGSARSSPSDGHTMSLGSTTSVNSTATISFGRSNEMLNSNDPVPEEAPLASGLLEAAKKIQEISNNWKAPGAERGSSKFDYDQQKLMASKAMQEKPLGLRVPNQQWAGLGFSRSMPAPVFRQAKSFCLEKSIDFGESSASSSSSGALQALDEDEEDKIGPWPLETPQAGQGQVAREGKELKARWKVIRDAYTKRQKKKPTGSAGKKSVSKYDSALKFLESGNHHRMTTSNLGQPSAGETSASVSDHNDRSIERRSCSAEGGYLDDNESVADGIESIPVPNRDMNSSEAPAVIHTNRSGKRQRRSCSSDRSDIDAQYLEVLKSACQSQGSTSEHDEYAFNMTTYFDSVHLPRPSNNVSLADIDDMAVVLSQLHLTKYIDTFREQEVDMNAFLTMTDADLKELGVNTFGARRKLLVAISEIKEHRRHFR